MNREQNRSSPRAFEPPQCGEAVGLRVMREWVRERGEKGESETQLDERFFPTEEGSADKHDAMNASEEDIVPRCGLISLCRRSISSPRRSLSSAMTLPKTASIGRAEEMEMAATMVGEEEEEEEGGHLVVIDGTMRSAPLCSTTRDRIGSVDPAGVREVCSPSPGVSSIPAAPSSDSEDENGIPEQHRFSTSAAGSPSSKSEAGSRIKLHMERYMAFVQRYFGLDESTALREARYVRTTCVSSVRLQTLTSKASRKKCFNRSQTVRVISSVPLPRHSAISVEGDYLFSRLIGRAEFLSVAARYIESGGKQAVVPPSVRLSDVVGFAERFKGSPTSILSPNARCIALHYGFPAEKLNNVSEDEQCVRERRKHPFASLIAIVTSGRIEKGTEIVVSMPSYFRCLDELGWYKHRYGRWSPVLPIPVDGVKHFKQWPAQLNYYHGVGHRHCSIVPQASYPFTLVELKETPEIGPNQLGLYASAYIPHGTCFIYGGSVATVSQVQHWLRGGPSTARSSVSSSEEKKESGEGGEEEDASPLREDLSDDTYALGLDNNCMCYGQGLSRYINHRYNLSPFGNVELCSIAIPMLSFRYYRSAAGMNDERTRRKKSSKNADQASRVQRSARGIQSSTRYLSSEKGGAVVTVPFFITTTDIQPHSQLLSWTYGEEYDAKLERTAVADGEIVPYADAEVLNVRCVLPPGDSATYRCVQRYWGDYRYALRVGDIVWCRRTKAGAQSCPEEDLHIVLEMQRESPEYALLAPLIRRHPTVKEWEQLLDEEDIPLPSAPIGGVKRTLAARKGAARSRKRGRDASAKYSGIGFYVAPQGSKRYPVQTTASLSDGMAVVAPTSYIGLLLADVDYYDVSSRFDANSRRTIVVPIDPLRQRTELVRTRSCVTPQLLHPSLWIMLRNAK